MVRVFDADRQEWAGPEQEARIASLHRRDAARQRQALRSSVTVLAVCGLAFGTWALGWKDEPEPQRYFARQEAPQDAGGAGQPGTEAGAEGSASPSPGAAPPDGYAVVPDKEGFRTAVPEGWSRRTSDSVHGFDVVNYRSPDESRRVQVYEVEEATPYASLQKYLEVAKPKGYDQIALDRTTDDGRDAAQLEYRADRIAGEPENGVWHVLDHRFEAVDGKLYAIAVYGADVDGAADEQELLATALAWFCPPDTECPEPQAPMD